MAFFFFVGTLCIPLGICIDELLLPLTTKDAYPDLDDGRQLVANGPGSDIYYQWTWEIIDARG
jgi:hypothetical protein